jgi:ubiquinone/menaquinone biosynthesis C-methylase UbiE
MDGRLQLRVQRYGWDRASTRYEELWREALAPATEGVLRLARLQPGERVLDVACGSGVLTRAALAGVGPQGEAVGCDVSEGMVSVARAASPGCRFLRTDAQALGDLLPPAHFDVVLCGLGLMYMPDPEACVAAMAACLRPGGRLVVSIWGERAACGWSGVFGIVDARVQSEVCPMFFRLGGGDALRTALEGAGLAQVRTERIATTIEYPDAATACDAAFEGGPVALAYGRFDAPTRDAVRAEYLDSLRPWARAEGFGLPGEFVFGEGKQAPAALPQ